VETREEAKEVSSRMWSNGASPTTATISASLALFPRQRRRERLQSTLGAMRELVWVEWNITCIAIMTRGRPINEGLKGRNTERSGEGSVGVLYSCNSVHGRGEGETRGARLASSCSKRVLWPAVGRVLQPLRVVGAVEECESALDTRGGAVDGSAHLL
jgi:hypothetical protein